MSECQFQLEPRTQPFICFWREISSAGMSDCRSGKTIQLPNRRVVSQCRGILHVRDYSGARLSATPIKTPPGNPDG